MARSADGRKQFHYVYGSIHGCADDFRPGQRYDDANRWSGCDVTYF